jgi:hypothetical protein
MPRRSMIRSTRELRRRPKRPSLELKPESKILTLESTNSEAATVSAIAEIKKPKNFFANK